MLNTFANVLDHASTIILVLSGSTEELSESLQETLNQVTLIFGKSWWDYAVIGVSFYHYDPKSILERNSICAAFPQDCKNETSVARKINALLRQKCSINSNVTFLFMDSCPLVSVDSHNDLQKLYSY